MVSSVADSLEIAKRRIEQNPSECNLSRLAEEVNISPFHFHRLFRRRFGETPLQLATRKRLDQVIRLLRDTDDSVLSVCQDAGFESPTTFAAWLHKQVGCSAREFRKFCRNTQDPRGFASFESRRIPIAMNAKLTSVTVFVNDQNSALEFYTEKLGFEVTADVTTPEGFRWLTVAPAQGETSLVLFPVGSSVGMSDDLVAAIEVMQKSAFCGPGVFEVDDCKALHQELVAKGVRVLQEPHEEAYGTQAMYLDDSGNALCFVQA